MFGPILLLWMLPTLTDDPPPADAVKREFRGVWIATVANIDWPSRKGLPVAEQQAELLKLFDRCRELELNAVVFQVRPMCDALYESPLEPWSEFLTGALGRAPEPKYDPLAFAISEAHARGLELHAWFNPYRAGHPSAKSDYPASHMAKRRPDLAKKYGKHYWLDPGEPEVQAHSLATILDVVKRYDVDGVHLDDYFYPYKEAGDDGKPLPFPDDASYDKYRRSGGKLERDDWRRDNVNGFVKRMYEEVKRAKPWVKVGISPFGIWRPGHPPGIQGFDQYAELYADAKLWLNEGWVDYFTPQLYWPIRQEPQSFPKLLAWWAGENKHGRHLWPGSASGRALSRAKNWTPGEVAEQIRVTRRQTGAGGNVHFSMKSLVKDSDMTKSVAKVYDEFALAPASPWLKDDPPPTPKPELKDGVLRADVGGAASARFYLVAYPNANGGWRFLVGKPEELRAGVPFRFESGWLATVNRVGQIGEWKRISKSTR